VSFGVLAGVQPGPGLVAFGAVVVLTMLSAESFDSRWIWES
jgi:paraquat-inducible protein A